MDYDKKKQSAEAFASGKRNGHETTIVEVSLAENQVRIVGRATLVCHFETCKVKLEDYMPANEEDALKFDATSQTADAWDMVMDFIAVRSSFRPEKLHECDAMMNLINFLGGDAVKHAFDTMFLQEFCCEKEGLPKFNYAGHKAECKKAEEEAREDDYIDPYGAISQDDQDLLDAEVELEVGRYLYHKLEALLVRLRFAVKHSLPKTMNFCLDFLEAMIRANDHKYFTLDHLKVVIQCMRDSVEVRDRLGFFVHWWAGCGPHDIDGIDYPNDDNNLDELLNSTTIAQLLRYSMIVHSLPNEERPRILINHWADKQKVLDDRNLAVALKKKICSRCSWEFIDFVHFPSGELNDETDVISDNEEEDNQESTAKKARIE